MSIEITDVKFQMTKSMNFNWNFNVSGTPWNKSSNDFLLKDMPSQCTLSMKCSSSSNNYTTNSSTVTMSITFANCNSILDGMDLIMIRNTEKKFIFHLKPQSHASNVFSATSTFYSESLFFEQIQNWKIVILYGHIPRYEFDSALTEDFKRLFESEQHSDFNIKSQNVTFKVHKGIVSCRCDVLAKAIDSDMVEKQKNEIQLDWDPLVVKELLTFIYTGSCEISLNPHHLFELANYYQLDELKNDCSKYLKDNMNLKSIVNTLQLADVEQYNLKDLKILARTFVEKNKTSLVKDMDFADYLSKSIRIDNILFVLSLSYEHKLKGPLNCAKEFIKKNYIEVLENRQCKNFLSSHGDLLIDIFKYSLDSQAKA